MNRRTLLTIRPVRLRRRTPAIARLGSAAQAAEESASGPAWRHGVSLFGDLKYPPGFKQFDYVNPQAPKGGDVRGKSRSAPSTISTGRSPASKARSRSGSISSTTRCWFRRSTKFRANTASLPRRCSYPDDFSSVTYRLRAEARWHDGKPVTPEDVIFSFDAFKKYSPQLAAYYRHVVKAEKTGDREITFTFRYARQSRIAADRRPASCAAQALVGRQRRQAARSATSARPRSNRRSAAGLIGSKSSPPGRNVVFERVKDYWGKDLNVNVGRDNFDELRFEYFRDSTVALEAFKADTVDWRTENSAKNWATAYDFPAVARQARRQRRISDPQPSG